MRDYWNRHPERNESLPRFFRGSPHTMGDSSQPSADQNDAENKMSFPIWKCLILKSQVDGQMDVIGNLSYHSKKFLIFDLCFTPTKNSIWDY